MQFLLTADVAAHLGCSSGNIRTIKFRHKDDLILGTHWIESEDNRTLWTPDGFRKLAEIICPEKEIPNPFETPPLQGEMLPSQTVMASLQGEMLPSQTDTGVLQAIADQIALASIEHELQQRIAESRRRILTAPTEADSLALAQSLDRIGHTLGLLKVSQAMLGAFKAVNAQAQSQPALLEGRNDG